VGTVYVGRFLHAKPPCVEELAARFGASGYSEDQADTVNEQVGCLAERFNSESGSNIPPIELGR
jgi:hypothetical protein